jgi:hypothetical protein
MSSKFKTVLFLKKYSSFFLVGKGPGVRVKIDQKIPFKYKKDTFHPKSIFKPG